MLREHYRCHPRIINFCNQKFYGGNLLIMTHDHGEEDVLCAYLTRLGNGPDTGRVRRLFQFHRSRHGWLHSRQCSGNR